MQTLYLILRELAAEALDQPFAVTSDDDIIRFLESESSLAIAFNEMLNNNLAGLTPRDSLESSQVRPRRIPISTGRKIAHDLGYTQVVIHGYDGSTGVQSVCTYGKTKADCANAAEGGNAIKRMLGWPEHMCNAKPARTKK